jgi:hypothetical protein
MRTANERGRAAVVLLAGLAAAALLGGCEAEDPVVVDVAGAQARLLVTFPADPAKAEGDFDLDLTLRIHEGREETIELQRTIEVRGWMAQGDLEVPSRVLVMIDARTVRDGQTYTGFGQVPPLEPGTSATIPLELFVR